MEAFYKVRDFSNIREMLEQSASLYGDRTAFEIKVGKTGKKILTFKQYMKDIDGLSNYFLSLDDESNYIAISSANCYEYCLTYLSTICAGKVIVPIDPELHDEDINGIINTCGAKIFICDRKIYGEMHDKLPDGVKIITIDSIADQKSIADCINDGITLINEGKLYYKDYVQDINKMCTLLFTSGTTGVSKGVMLCQKNFMFEIKAAMGVLKIYPEDCGISMLPLHHTFESSIIIFFAPFCGAKVTFCEGFKYVLRNMKEFEPTIFVAVPMVLEIVHKRIIKAIKAKKFGNHKFKAGKAICKFGSKFNLDLKKIVFKEIQETFGGKMRMIICGGASIDPQIIKDFDSFGIQVLYGYGLTECAPLAIINNDRVRTTDSIGKPLPGVDVKIIHPDDEGVGELCVRGGMVMLGYYQNQEATDEVIDSDGYLHTGDLAVKDKNGCYHITGRSKNVIVTANGKNIYPEELEYHLSQSNYVNACLVEEITNSRGEPEIHAQIYPEYDELKNISDGGHTNEKINEIMKEVVASVNDKLPGFKRIKSYTVREEDFERTTAKKIKRNGANKFKGTEKKHKDKKEKKQKIDN